MKRIILILVIVISSCNNQKTISKKSNELIGYYKAMPEKSIFNMFKRVSYGVNTELLVKNNILEMKTCSYNAIGKWKVRSDTFFFKLDKLRWLIDSLNTNQKYIDIKNKIISYKNYYLITNKGLYRKVKTKNRETISNMIKLETAPANILHENW